ncbi:glycosyl transferase [Paraclostridium bifermentans]|uniref:glycosyl transferase n=1 Tax=Paraclostridium TaxID=1849822 RepID=UPI0011593A3D|nr:glycosyl transferase [Paraclostridium bifermentans]MCE9676789.1 hypothetical protein [Paraclostridium bifermentans]MCU9807325.1 hypothetical protein [Paraclostridium sp. AKS46]MDV8114620.1 glycosyl transferase [Bacillus sp. BAU-SS-2023]TQO56276.1 glycosyl transferase [Paraclostridium bifermentans]
MKNQIKYFLLGIITILFSSPLGYLFTNLFYSSKNLANEFNIVSNGFINSFMLIGALIFSVGLVNLFSEKSNRLK